MKKTIISMVVALAAITANGQTLKGVIKEFKDKPDAEHVHISKMMMGALKAFDFALPKGGNMEMAKVGRVDSLNVLSMDDCSAETRQDFLRKLSAIDFAGQGYELLMKTNDDGDDVKIYVKPNGDVFKEIVVIAGGTEDATLVQVFGKIDPSKFME